MRRSGPGARELGRARADPSPIEHSVALPLLELSHASRDEVKMIVNRQGEDVSGASAVHRVEVGHSMIRKLADSPESEAMIDGDRPRVDGGHV